MKKNKATISRITIGRLYNLGNYEHVRYELTADIPAGVKPAAVLVNVLKIIRAVDPKPPSSKYELARALEIVAKVEASTEIPEHEKDNLNLYRDRIRIHANWKANREKALEALDRFGGTEKLTDAKLSWGDDDDGY